MADSEQNAGTPPSEKPKEPTKEEKSVPMSAYQELQRQMQKDKDRLKAFEAKEREGESAEDALKREREETARLNRELGLERAKRLAPDSLHGLIDKFVEKHGIVPDAEDIALLKANTKTETPPGDTPGGDSSGLRNVPAGKPKDGAELTDDDLRRIKLSDIRPG